MPCRAGGARGVTAIDSVQHKIYSRPPVVSVATFMSYEHARDSFRWLKTGPLSLIDIDIDIDIDIRGGRTGEA